MIKVTSHVKVYEMNGEPVPIAAKDEMIIRINSHWNRREFVILQLPNGDHFTVNENDLIAAIENAVNVAR